MTWVEVSMFSINSTMWGPMIPTSSTHEVTRSSKVACCCVTIVVNLFIDRNVCERERAGLFLFVAMVTVKLSFCKTSSYQEGHTTLLHIYVPFQTREGGWVHSSWLCPSLVTNLPWSLSSFGISLTKVKQPWVKCFTKVLPLYPLQ